ncbi:MAG: response regulator [Thermodesulfobacteriota bacterium]|nr:response regulator [Thermodesulfobacteriota bacterium]
MKLLVIDDERSILEMLELSLSKEGYEVLTAENGEEGVKRFQEQRPKLVLTDVKMPGIDGIEVLKRIKAMDAEAEVIVITGHGDMDTAIAALQNQASDFVTKPIRDDVLMVSLQRAEKRVAMSEQLKNYTENLERQMEECKLGLMQAQAELIATERRASIGETVSALAHCVKNILTGLGGGMYMVHVGMAREKAGVLEDGWAMFQRNMERVSDLVLDLLRYSREIRPERRICRPNRIASEAMEDLRKRAEEHHVMLHSVLDPGLKAAYLDRDGIYKVLSNLIANAVEACVYDTATSKTWEVTIKTKLETEADSEETILFEVTDNGCGMTDEVKEQIFHKFFTTKPGQGIGLDLLLAQKIVREHDGEIMVESKVGKGTTCSVRLNCQIPEEQ